MSDHSKVAIFWDYENCNPPSTSYGLGYDIVNNISRIARLFGSVTTFRAYLDISAQSSKSVVLRSELQSSGVSMIDCPHNGKKDVVDKMILVDMLAFAVDQPAPATIILITGDRDYAYAVSILKLRKYQVILVAPSSPHTSPSLESQASLVIDWGTVILRTRTEPVNSTQAARQPYIDLDANLTAKLFRELQDLSLDDPDPTSNLYSNTYQGASRQRRISARDLLEPSKHSKNVGSFDSAQESIHTPASPRKSTSTASDSGPGGLPIPKTPSRSRCASVSTGSTRARSTTIVAQSLAVEQDHPVKNPPPSSARRSSISDGTDVAGPAKRSQSVLPSLDPFELPLHDNRPPSSIHIRSPLEPGQSAGNMPVSGKPGVISSQKLDCLASPFVMTSKSTGLDTTVKPTSPIVAPTKTLPRTVTTARETLQTKDTQVPKEIEHLPGLRKDNSERSVPHRVQEGARDATDAPESNYYSCVASHLTYSPSSRNVGLHFTNNTLDASDGVDSAQFAAFSRASNTLDHAALSPESVPSSSAFPSTPSTTTESHEHEGRTMWTMFKSLVHILLAARENGIARPSRSTVAVDLVQSDSQVYKRAGVSKFKEYTALAEQAGIIVLGGREATAWIALHPDWFGMDGITTNCLSNGEPSPTFDPPKAIQSPLLTGSKTPLIERTAIFPTPTAPSPKPRSLDSSNTLTNSPTNRHDTIPARFQPLIDILVQMRAEGSEQTLRSLVGQSLGQDVYAQAGVSGFKEYVHQASEAQLVQFGGVGGYAWIGLHPELRM